MTGPKVLTLLAFLASADSFGTIRSDVCPPVTQEYDCSNEVGYSAALDFWFGDLLEAGCWSCGDDPQPEQCSQAPCTSNTECRGGQYAGLPFDAPLGYGLTPTFCAPLPSYPRAHLASVRLLSEGLH